jgi:hypothetical protein
MDLGYRSRDLADSLLPLAKRYKGIRALSASKASSSYNIALDHSLSIGGNISSLLSPLRNLRHALTDIQKGIDNISREITPHYPDSLLDDMLGRVADLRRITHFATDAIIDLPVFDANSIPPQTPAPIKVRISGNRLVVSNDKHNEGPVQNPGINRVRAAAAEMLASAIDTIDMSGNVDKRIASALQPLLRHLSADQDDLSVEALGINWRLVNAILANYRDQLPDIAIIQIEAALDPISVILNQYEEWRVFQTSEASAHFNSDDAQVLLAGAQEIIDEIEKAGPQIADPEISNRIKEMLRPISTGVVRAESMFAPLISSLSNVFAGAAEIILSLAPKLSLPTTGPSYGLVIIALSLLDKGGHLAKLSPFKFVSAAHNHAVKHHPWLKDIWKA